MILLILGVLLWSVAHLYRRMTPDLYASLGAKNKPIVALGSIAGIVLMVIGYRAADYIAVYEPPAFLRHINNLLMIVAFVMMFMGSVGSWLSKRMRHPMLIGFKTWAFAHLLVNGDLASIILFGGLLAWAVFQMIKINKTSPPWEKDRAAKLGGRDAVLLGVALLGFVLAAGIHIWLGVNPFGAGA